ncbi:MAG: hypothetical protein M5U15_07015 [Kiritimatiellae bacterium]|nr:hypothetical protein [Kiritimatiellia bacterium]
MKQLIRFFIAIPAAVLSVALSWPYARNYEYWAESPGMWKIYFIAGFILAVAVFYFFLESLAVLFQHDELARKGNAASGDAGKEKGAP